MSTAYTQQQPLKVKVGSLADDVLLLKRFAGSEGVSQLFHYHLELLSPHDKVGEITFDKVLGKPVSVALEMADANQRFFNGICSRFGQGESGAEFTEFYMEIVPFFWLWTRRAQSRIFQHVKVGDILKKVLEGLDVKLQLEGNYENRDYCVQYRETDFNFASRLMEEEGIYYYFKHTEGGHQMIVADTPGGHADLPAGSTITLRELPKGTLEEDIIYDWKKRQGITSGKYTLWDYRFEMPQKHLEAEAKIQPDTQIGQASHKLQVADNSQLEIYDWPGEYAQRFDGVDKGGGDQDSELQKVFKDNTRTTKLRMEAETVQGIAVEGASNCRQMMAGHAFTVESVPGDAMTKHIKADGKYVLTKISHSAINASDENEFRYSNSFTCIPASLPFRPQRTTPKPVVPGTQTAVVVGPDGEEIFTDKYGRVKVQFHWDREGKFDSDSSCWIRVAQVWAGKLWGGIQIPRIGHEVLVDFLEGDPDQPIIVGSTYNADNMPPWKLPDKKVVSGIKSDSTLGSGGYNEFSFDDTKGKEMITLHGQYDMATTIEHDESLTVHNNRTITVDGTHTETINKDTTITISKGKLEHTVADNTATYTVKQDITENYNANQSTTVDGNLTISVTGKASGGGNVLIEAKEKIVLNTGKSTLTMLKDGTITIDGKTINIIGSEAINDSAPTIAISGTKQTQIGVGAQTVTCDPAKVVTSGAGIAATAVGVHEITGALVKIN
ncbi:MAG: type VI secretion system Vgr family protein [Gemmataceae bacterium]